jgi:hypothetical protein
LLLVASCEIRVKHWTGPHATSKRQSSANEQSTSHD